MGSQTFTHRLPALVVVLLFSPSFFPSFLLSFFPSFSVFFSLCWIQCKDGGWHCCCPASRAAWFPLFPVSCLMKQFTLTPPHPLHPPAHPHPPMKTVGADKRSWQLDDSPRCAVLCCVALYVNPSPHCCQLQPHFPPPLSSFLPPFSSLRLLFRCFYLFISGRQLRFTMQLEICRAQNTHVHTHTRTGSPNPMFMFKGKPPGGGGELLGSDGGPVEAGAARRGGRDRKTATVTEGTAANGNQEVRFARLCVP